MSPPADSPYSVEELRKVAEQLDDPNTGITGVLLAVRILMRPVVHELLEAAIADEKKSSSRS